MTKKVNIKNLSVEQRFEFIRGLELAPYKESAAVGITVLPGTEEWKRFKTKREKFEEKEVIPHSV